MTNRHPEVRQTQTNKTNTDSQGGRFTHKVTGNNCEWRTSEETHTNSCFALFTQIYKWAMSLLLQNKHEGWQYYRLMPSWPHPGSDFPPRTRLDNSWDGQQPDPHAQSYLTSPFLGSNDGYHNQSTTTHQSLTVSLSNNILPVINLNNGLSFILHFCMINPYFLLK